MNVIVIEPKKHYILVEYTDRLGLQRKWISRDLVNTSIRGAQFQLNSRILNTGIEYSDIRLNENLGFVEGLNIRRLEQEMRKAGLWTRQDYKNYPNVVAKVLRDFPETLDVATIINSAVYIGDTND